MATARVTPAAHRLARSARPGVFPQVRVQSGWQGCTNSIQALKLTLQLRGFRGLYTGLPAPLVGATAEAGILFLTQAKVKAAVESRWGVSGLPATMLGGAVSGAIVSCILTPAELLKCQAQAHAAAAELGPIGVARQILATQGVKGLYTGHAATVAREIPGTAAWFGAYSIALDAIAALTGENVARPGALSVIASGAVGGCAYWTLFYPVDTVKSLMQTSEQAAAMGALGTARAIVRGAAATGGATAVVKRLYGGLGPTLLKAAPGNAAIFGVYELCARLLEMYCG